MQKENLSEKAIWDFTKEDTIYIRGKKNNLGNSIIYLCQFRTLVRNTVYGIIIDSSADKRTREGLEKGEEVYADIKNCALYGKGVEDGNSHYHWFNVIGYAYKAKGLERIEEVKEHPSFGLVGLSRRTSSGVTPLFGSNIQHQHTITLTIKRAENNRHLNRDWFHGREQLIEIELSGSQFSELITSFNMGDGVPCTIRQIGNKSLPDPPYENPIDIFQKEFASKMNNLGIECQSLIEDCLKMLKEKATIGKADRDFIAKSIASLMQQIQSNVPFVAEQFNESMNKTVSQAKTEIETFVTNKMISIGIDVTKTNPDLFLKGTKIDDNKQIDGDKK